MLRHARLHGTGLWGAWGGCPAWGEAVSWTEGQQGAKLCMRLGHPRAGGAVEWGRHIACATACASAVEALGA